MSTLRSSPVRFSAVLRFGALLLVVLSSACSKPGAGGRGDAAARDTSMSRDDSLVSAMVAPPSYMDSLRADRDRELLATGMAANSSQPVESSASAVSSPQSRRVQSQTRATAGAGAPRTTNKPAAYAAIMNAPAAAGDTVRGIVKIIGAAPATQVVLVSPSAHAVITLSGMGTDDLRPLAGLDILIRGIKVSERDVVVNGFVVRMADGNPAWDGRLELSGGEYQLRLTDGSGLKHVAQLPSALRDETGTRVWISMKPGSAAPQSFGVIERR
jgi:hypothetical protein